MTSISSISAEAIPHYIFQTPQTFLNAHNSFHPLTPFFSFAIQIIVIFQGEIILLKHPTAKIWMIPMYIHSDLSNQTIASRCYTALNQTGVHFLKPQIMEPAFQKPLLDAEPEMAGGRERGLCNMSLLVTVTARPWWPEGDDNNAMLEAQMRPFQNHIPGEVIFTPPSHANFEAQQDVLSGTSPAAVPATRGFVESTNGVSVELYRILESWQRWMGIGISTLHLRKEEKTTSSSSKDTAYILFETTEEVFGKIAMNEGKPVFEITDNGRYSLRGASFWKLGNTDTHLCSLTRDGMEDSFAKNGRIEMR